MSIERETTRSLGSSTGSPAITATSPMRTQRARLVAVLGADVDVQVLELGDLLAVLVLEQVDRLLADDAGDDARRAWRRSTRWPTRICGSQPPTPMKRRKPVVVDVGDDQADLVDVADDRQRRAAARARARGRTTEPIDVGRDLGEGRGGLAEDGGGRGLVARRAGAR